MKNSTNYTATKHQRLNFVFVAPQHLSLSHKRYSLVIQYTYITAFPSEFMKKQIAYKINADLVISLIEVMLTERKVKIHFHTLELF